LIVALARDGRLVDQWTYGHRDLAQDEEVAYARAQAVGVAKTASK
jgi:hypothetical protein